MNNRRIEHLKLSILIVTYNHERYISKALDSIYNQIFDCSVEVIIADDASSDRTLGIIKEYESKESRFRFKYLDSTKNLGITKNYQRGFAACSGEYVAVLEGDDYWISPFKLQRQIDFLNIHYESDLCAVNYFIFEENSLLFYARSNIGNGHTLFGARDIIADNIVSNFSTFMMRKSALDELPQKLFEIHSYDWIVSICLARTSLIGFLQEPMSVYRNHSNGTWTAKSSIEKLKEQMAVIKDYDNLTNNVFHENFEALSNQLRTKIIREKYANSIGKPTRFLARIISRSIDYIRPILLTAAKALIPPKLKQLMAKLFK
jgi:glycosyltransferase involved in cell wall biosynthesis